VKRNVTPIKNRKMLIYVQQWMVLVEHRDRAVLDMAVGDVRSMYARTRVEQPGPATPMH
jgi:hypothetical protein